ERQGAAGGAPCEGDDVPHRARGLEGGTGARGGAPRDRPRACSHDLLAAPECWKANQAPVRPNPDMTSSLIHSTSWASQRRRSSSRKPGGGTRTPLPEPPTPSNRTAAVRRRSS